MRIYKITSMRKSRIIPESRPHKDFVYMVPAREIGMAVNGISTECQHPLTSANNWSYAHKKKERKKKKKLRFRFYTIHPVKSSLLSFYARNVLSEIKKSEGVRVTSGFIVYYQITEQKALCAKPMRLIPAFKEIPTFLNWKLILQLTERSSSSWPHMIQGSVRWFKCVLRAGSCQTFWRERLITHGLPGLFV